MIIKKILSCLLIVFLLTACTDSSTINKSSSERYNSMIEQLVSRTDFKTSSEYFDIAFQITSIDGGYRFYITIDNPKVAMYNVEAIAIESGVDYSNNMAANIGLFENGKYSLIPNQSNISKGFVKGVNISGTTTNAEPTLYVLVVWSNKDLSITKREFFRLGVTNEE